MRLGVLGLVWLAACGGRALETIDERPGCPLPPIAPPPPPARLLDDVEDNNLLAIAGDGIDGGWEFWNDQSNPALRFEATGACAAFGARAVHGVSPGQTGWGASINFFFRGLPRPKPFDGRAYNGVSVYLATGASNPVEVLTKVSVSTMDTAWQGRCTNCVDNFAKRVIVGPRWQRFELKFSELKQEGWGIPANVTFRQDEIVQLHIALEGRFDIWVDQVAFERF